MHCASCGSDNPEGMKFCGECGTLMTRRCVQCGFENPPAFKFCGECGSPLAGQIVQDLVREAEEVIAQRKQR